MVYIFGGISLDIIASKKCFDFGTSNPLKFSIRIGGVGFNILNHLEYNHNIFISAIGNDAFGQLVVEKVRNQNFNITIQNIGTVFCLEDASEKVDNKNNKVNSNESNDSPSKKMAQIYEDRPSFKVFGDSFDDNIYLIKNDKYQTSIYSAFMEGGNCLVAAADFEIIEKTLTFDIIHPILEKVESKDICVIDSNLDPEECEKIILFLNSKGCIIFFETISLQKTLRVAPILKNIFFTAPDVIEFNALLEGYSTVEEMIKDRNIQYILKTDGKNGSILYGLDLKEPIHFKPPEELAVYDTTGAGDFLLSKIIEAFLMSKKIEESINYASEKVVEYLKELNK
jgi:sugar/nucleoside kinase (ribokinase family)